MSDTRCRTHGVGHTVSDFSPTPSPGGARCVRPKSDTRDQRKCTESVSPPSSQPDRPSPKRLSAGRAFVLRRSVLGALGNLPAHSVSVKAVEQKFQQIPPNDISRCFSSADGAQRRPHAETHRGRCSLVRPPDQPPPKRLLLGGPSTSGAPSSVQFADYGRGRCPSSPSENEISLFAAFSLQCAHNCDIAHML